MKILFAIDNDVKTHPECSRTLRDQVKDTIDLYDDVFALPNNPFDRIIQMTKIAKVVCTNYVENTIRG